MKEIKLKEIVFNYRILRLIFYFLFSLVILVFADGAVLSYFIVIPFMIIFLFLILISPTHYTFTENALTINHLFGIKEIIEYKHIRSVSECIESGTRHWIIPMKYYYIAYPHEQKYFFLASEVRKSKKAKRLLEHYTNKEIE